MKLKCEICEEGEKFECDSPYDMIKHLETHCNALEMLIDKMIKSNMVKK